MGKYGNAAQWICNLQYKNHIYIPIRAHSTLGYNNHLIIPKISEEFKERKFTYVGNIVVYIFLADKKIEKVKICWTKF